jgi:glutamine amidotransferase
MPAKVGVLKLTPSPDSWVTVPNNTVLTISKQTVMIHPILDEFYSANPSDERSATFAQTKGQTVTNAQKEVILQQPSPATSSIELALPE